MDVLNFAHGALFSWGAYAGFSVAILVNGSLGLGRLRRPSSPTRGCSSSRWRGAVVVIVRRSASRSSG